MLSLPTKTNPSQTKKNGEPQWYQPKRFPRNMCTMSRAKYYVHVRVCIAAFGHCLIILFARVHSTGNANNQKVIKTNDEMKQLNAKRRIGNEILNDFMKPKARAPNALECAQMHVIDVEWTYEHIGFQFAYYVNMFHFYLKFHRCRQIEWLWLFDTALIFLCVLIVAYRLFAPTKWSTDNNIFLHQFSFCHFTHSYIVSAKWTRIDRLRSYRCSCVLSKYTKSWSHCRAFAWNK